MRPSRFFARARGQRGLSLIEVISSVSIFGVIAAGSAVGTISSVRGNTTSRMNAAASALIQDKIEQFRALDPSTNPADFTAGLHVDQGNPMTETGSPGGRFKRMWSVSRNTPSMGLAEVVVFVNWNDGQYRTISSTTYVCITKKCA